MIKGQNIPQSNIPGVQKLDAKAYTTDLLRHEGTYNHNNIHAPESDKETVTSVGVLILGATEKSPPDEADMLPVMDTTDSNKIKKLSWSNVMATLKTYFDTLYQAAGTYLTSGGALGTPASGNLANCSFPTLNQNTSGTAAKATILETARAISGTNFDGSGAITVDRLAATTTYNSGTAQVGAGSDTLTVFGKFAYAAVGVAGIRVLETDDYVNERRGAVYIQTLNWGGTGGYGLRDDIEIRNGHVKLYGGFGCNGNTAQTKYTVNAASTDLPSVIALCNQLRAALVANGIAQ